MTPVDATAAELITEHATHAAHYIAAELERMNTRRPLPTSPLFPFKTLADLKQANSASGHFWFDIYATRNRVDGNELHGNPNRTSLFIESRKYDSGTVGFSVYFAAPCGRIIAPEWADGQTTGAFRSLEEARTARDALARAITANGFLARYTAQTA